MRCLSESVRLGASIHTVTVAYMHNKLVLLLVLRAKRPCNTSMHTARKRPRGALDTKAGCQSAAA